MAGDAELFITKCKQPLDLKLKSIRVSLRWAIKGNVNFHRSARYFSPNAQRLKQRISLSGSKGEINDDMSTKLSERPRLTLAQRATNAAANVLQLCQTLEGMRDDFIPLLPKLEDETVIAVRMGARAVSVWAWVIECACDAEMFSRVEAAKRGPKKTDEYENEDTGRVKAAAQQAYQDAKSVRTVYRNAQLFNTFGPELFATHGKELVDKGFWIAALDAPDPVEAIEVFAEKKTENPFWEVQDAQREVDVIKGKHRSLKRQFSEVINTIGRQVASEWLRFTAVPELHKLQTSCPMPELAKVFGETIKECEQSADALFLNNAQECVLYIWSLGNHTEKQLQEFTCLPAVEIRRVLSALADKGYFVEKEQAWKPAQARGSRVKEWHRTDKPMPPLKITLPSGPLNLEL